MQLSPSAHVDTFCRDQLPPAAQWPEFTFELPELAYPAQLNCAEALLDDTIAAHGAQRPCLRSTTESWTYAEVRQRANQIAQVLTEDFALVPGNRVLLRGPNNPWLVACWLGVLKAGGVVVTTMPLLRPNELTALGVLTKPSIAISDHRFLDDLLAAELPGTPVLSYGTDSANGLSARCADKSGEFVAVQTAADDVALLAATSGTTGKPKITMHFHRDVLAIADTFGKHVLRTEPGDLFTGTPPVGFTFGLGGLVVFPMRRGATTLLLERVSPTELAEAIAAHRVTVLFTAPTAYKAMLAAGKAPRLASLRRCVSAGEHLPEAVWREFDRLTGLRIIDGIGSTEMLHVFISSADERIRPGATGQAVPGYQARILDEAGQEVPDGVAGRLAVRGPTGCRYLAGDRQPNYVVEGWNITGDTYIRDAEGYFWYQARSDDMIISAGYNIAAPEVEEALAAHPDVLECAVIGTPDEQRGALVTAYVVLNETANAGPAMANELQAFVKQAISPYKYPRRIEFIEALPRTSTGKVKRFALRESATTVTG
ncbi:2-aminobenzoate-CoA ligase [Tamaricihabitans halophyticus]|uniref:2-aminobenzoate-CoA ligase n=1 Tax=Tamaricihabitans halophyticus TaxID=1262583 RepID=A0A4R2QYT7_9PSEU|nr:AMP-binding protein [Tamaricihabitans halophyticus]TCP54228.1 2-aminobenzoate-CoA ligase [Tamaricihabitans halophyticus]